MQDKLSPPSAADLYGLVQLFGGNEERVVAYLAQVYDLPPNIGRLIFLQHSLRLFFFLLPTLKPQHPAADGPLFASEFWRGSALPSADRAAVQRLSIVV